MPGAGALEIFVLQAVSFWQSFENFFKSFFWKKFFLKNVDMGYYILHI